MANLTITPAQVLAGTDCDFYQGIAGETVAAGQACYLDDVTNRLRLADANASQETAAARGISLHAASSEQPLRLAVSGTLTLGAGAAPLLSTIYIAGATAGGIAPAADLAAGWYTSLLGVGGPNNTLIMNVFASGSLKA